MTTCRDKIRPELIPYYEIIRDAEPGKDVAIVQVDRGWAVHHVWHNNHRTYYIRVWVPDTSTHTNISSFSPSTQRETTEEYEKGYTRAAK